MTWDSPFLGTGWSFPPEFSQGGAHVGLVSGAQDVHQSLQILFSTRPGERILRESYGCDLSLVQFEDMDQALVNTLRRLITDAVLRFEPRVDLEDVQVVQDNDQPGLLQVLVSYTVRATNSRYNMVFPFHLQEADAGAAG